MIYLHFKPVEDILWTEVLDSDQIHIMIPRITIRELDNKKDSHPSRKIKERARRVLQRIEAWGQAQPTPIRPGVDVKLYNQLPTIDFGAHNLDPTRNDDVLIATILDYKKCYPKAEVLLITEDTTPRITARGLGLEAVALPDTLKLPTEPDPVEQENQQLRKELEQIKVTLPKLALCFHGQEPANRLSVKINRPLSQAVYVQQQMQALRNKYPKLSNPGVIGPSILFPSESEYRRYNADLEHFFVRYEKYVSTQWEEQQKIQLTVGFELELRNEGSASAIDVDVHLQVPNRSLSIVEESNIEPSSAKAPEPPRPPRSVTEIASEHGSQFSVIMPSVPDYSFLAARNYGPPSLPNVSRPILREGANEHTITWNVRRVKHGSTVSFNRLAVAFADFDSASSFGIEYQLRAENLPTQAVGKLHVVVEKQ